MRERLLHLEIEPSSMCYLLEKGIATHHSILGASLGAQTVKNLPVMQETWV